MNILKLSNIMLVKVKKTKKQFFNISNNFNINFW